MPEGTTILNYAHWLQRMLFSASRFRILLLSSFEEELLYDVPERDSQFFEHSWDLSPTWQLTFVGAVLATNVILQERDAEAWEL